MQTILTGVRVNEEPTIAVLILDCTKKRNITNYIWFLKNYIKVMHLTSTKESSLVVVLDKADEVNHNRFNAGSGELGFYKFYFQLIHHWMLMDNSYQVFVDYKTNGYQHRVQELGIILNNTSTAELTQIQALPSEQSVLIQLADVLTGAVASAFNRTKSQSNAKQSVRELIENRLGHCIKATSVVETKFNVFNINLRKDW